MDLERDLAEALGWNRVNMLITGVWPDPETRNGRSGGYRALISCSCIMSFIVMPQTLNLFRLDGDLELITQTLTLAQIPALNAVIKIAFAWYRQTDLQPLVKSFYDDWYTVRTEEERETMLNHAKVTKNISICCTILTQTMVTAYISLRLFEILTSDWNEESQHRLVIYPGFFPFNVRPTLICILINMAQVFAAYCATIPYTGVDSFIAMLVIHTSGQFENLRRKLEKLMEETNGPRKAYEREMELVWIVKRHEHQNWMAASIEKSFNKLLLLQMLLCTVEICFQWFLFFSVIMKDENGLLNFQMVFFVLFVVFITVHIYLYCYVGELLLVGDHVALFRRPTVSHRSIMLFGAVISRGCITMMLQRTTSLQIPKGSSMAISAYNTSWYNVTPAEARCLLFIMLRSTRPLCLTAGKFGTFSMELFSSVIRTAMGYLSVLLTVTGSDN